VVEVGVMRVELAGSVAKLIDRQAARGVVGWVVGEWESMCDGIDNGRMDGWLVG